MSTKKKNSFAVHTAIDNPFSIESVQVGPKNTLSTQCCKSEAGLVVREESCWASMVVVGLSGDLSACSRSSVRKVRQFCTELVCLQLARPFTAGLVQSSTRSANAANVSNMIQCYKHKKEEKTLDMIPNYD